MIKSIQTKICSILNCFAFLPPLLARISLAIVFIQAGWGKLHNLDRVIGYFDSLGIPAASIQAPFVAGLEFVGGILLLIGLLTRPVSALLASTMAVAILTAVWPKLESKIEVFGVSEWAYILLFLYLIFNGAGKVSVDAKLCCKHTHP